VGAFGVPGGRELGFGAILRFNSLVDLDNLFCLEANLLLCSFLSVPAQGGRERVFRAGVCSGV
jgi:hypothetical protein